MFYTLWIRKKNVVDEIDLFNESGNEYSPINRHKRMKNVVVTLITITVCFVSCWFCNLFYYTLFHFDYDVDFTSDFYHSTVLAVFCHCFINPIVYMVQYKQFKEHAEKIICSCYLLKVNHEEKYQMGSTICPSDI